MSTVVDSPQPSNDGTAAPAATDAPKRVSIKYQPALDGVRAFALLGMLVFHNGFAWLAGGFLSVSTFFTLSGFLITSLLLAERESTGDIALKEFWGRRFKRLVPGALAGIVFMLGFGVLVANSIQRSGLRADALWSLFYGANWHFIAKGTSYADIFSGGAESPAQHFWTLAIEEQFYLVFPLLMFGVLRLVQGRRSRLAMILGGLWLVSFGLNLLYYALDWSTDRIYFGTDTRAAELLAGALLAVALAGRETIRDRRVQRLLVFLGPSAVSAILLLWAFTDLGTQWLYFGGFSLYTVFSVLLITAAVQPVGVIRKVFALQPLPWIGKVSYGAYLYHWPLFVYLRDQTDIPEWPRFAIGMVVTFILAELSYRFIESPVRNGAWSKGRRPAILLPSAAVAVLVLTLVITASYKPAITLDPDSIEQAGDPSLAIEGAPRVAFFGDSTMLTLAYGLGPWVDARTDLVKVPGAADLGCGIGRDGWRQYLALPVAAVDPECWDVPWAERVETYEPDVALVMVGPWDVTDRWLPGDDPSTDPPRFPGEPAFDEYIQSEMLAATDLLAADGAKVVWLTSPHVELGMIDGELPHVEYPRAYVDDEGERHYVGSDPVRMDRYNQLIKELPNLRPDTVAVIDLAGYLAAQPSGPVTPDLKPDGIHFTKQGASAVVQSWLGDELAAAIASFGPLGTD